MTPEDFYKKWSTINWSDNSQHFAEKKFIDSIDNVDQLSRLEPQVPIGFIDNRYRKTGYIDFVLDKKYPIEIDWAHYHAPDRVKPERFDSLTAKQNEVVNKYGNITRITYQMLKNDPEGAIRVLNKNVKTFKEQERKYNELLAELNDVKARKDFEEKTMAARRKEFEEKLRKEIDLLEAEANRLRKEQGILTQENSDLNAKNKTISKNINNKHQQLSQYNIWWQKHIKTLVILISSIVVTAIGITTFLVLSNAHQDRLRQEAAKANRVSQIAAGKLCMDIDEVPDFVNKTGVCVRYFVNYVGYTKYGYIWISDKKNGTFTGFIKNPKVMSISEAKSYQNKTIELHGDIIKYEKDGTTINEIIIGSKHQIKVVEDWTQKKQQRVRRTRNLIDQLTCYS